jgi:Tfp pilus assembly pilus retraction ATPase PilT
MAKINAFFNLMNETGASDLHLVAGSQPILRVSGELARMDHQSANHAVFRYEERFAASLEAESMRAADNCGL